MKSPYDVIKRPLITEKANLDKERRNAYHFEVPLTVDGLEIKQAIETMFGVKVEDVRTQIVRGKFKRLGKQVGKRPNWKKAIVVLKAGDKIDVFEGL